jgi:hypothetical protein
MSAVIPVQIEPCTVDGPGKRPLVGVCGTCTKCGKTASAALDPDDGGPATRRKVAVAAVCAELTEACAERLPWGSTPAHDGRRAPKGVSLFAVDAATAGRWPVSVTDKDKLATVASGVHPLAVVLVVPDDESCSEAAAEFAQDLVGRGYLCAQTTLPGGEPIPEKRKPVKK